jgi:hypothetical protein
MAPSATIMVATIQALRAGGLADVSAPSADRTSIC